MKLVRDTTGRFLQRPHYEPQELDRECEGIISNFLKKKYGRVDFPVSTDDLTTFIEQEADDLDLYADLSAFGANVEGVTIFVPGGKAKVKISSALSEDPARENRLRTTLTHEFGHVYFHNYLFDQASATLDLFAPSHSNAHASGRDGRTQVCKRETMLEAANTDWMEWQAGHVCGALLMPASRVRRLVHEGFAHQLEGQVITPVTPVGMALIEAVMAAFHISQDAARVRLLRLGILTSTIQTARLF
jgi:hypothetical protein